MARAFERALRRAGVPMAYSQGFNPHPKVSWVGAAPTGVASEAEYVEISLIRALDAGLVGREIDKALPPGLDVVDAVTAAGGSLPDRMQASEWHIVVDGVARDALALAAEAFLAAERLPVTRLTKDGSRELDARGPVLELTVLTGPVQTPTAAPVLARAGSGPGCGTLRAVVRQVSPAVRPDDVMSALLAVAGLELPVPVRATRVAQGPLDDSGALGDPFAPDREADPTGSGVRPGCNQTPSHQRE